MRLALAFVLAWFGLHELHNPSDWTVFAPSFVVQHAPHQVNNLVLLHGFLLTLAAASVLLGLVYAGGTLLATGILAAVILELLVDGGVSDVLIRDVGVLGLASALLVDPVRVWHLDDAISARVQEWQRPANKKKKAQEQQLSPRAMSWTRAGSAAALTVAVLALAAVLRVTGTSGAGLPSGASVFSGNAASPTAAATVEATQGPAVTDAPVATPAAPEASPSPVPAAGPTVTTVLFDSWRFHDKSFQVYPGPIAPETKQALAGFDLTLQDQGSQVVLNLKALSSRYHDASISLDKANTAYFVETSMHDDPNDQENNLNDDGVIVVNAQGYIVQ
jgi:hypothetical protein